MQYYFGWQIIKNKIANFPNTNQRYGIIQVCVCVCVLCLFKALGAGIVLGR